jgi:hypothetical protein
MALFDANGRLLGTRSGGVSDELESGHLNAQLARWVDGLLRPPRRPPKTDGRQPPQARAL